MIAPVRRFGDAYFGRMWEFYQRAIRDFFLLPVSTAMWIDWYCFAGFFLKQ